MAYLYVFDKTDSLMVKYPAWQSYKWKMENLSESEFIITFYLWCVSFQFAKTAYLLLL